MRTAVAIFSLASTALAVAATAPGAAAAVDAPALRFEQVFSSPSSSAPLHFRARYLTGQTGHVVETWREGGRLVRRTDDAIELHATKSTDEANFDLVVMDLKRKISTRVDRSSLYRIGSSLEWTDMAQGLRHPRASYDLVAGTAPATAVKPIGPCDWYVLRQASLASSICWNASRQLPLLIVGADGRVMWQVSEMDSTALPASIFEVHDEGYVRNDAGQDISGD